jgi:hypothetical protein
LYLSHLQPNHQLPSGGFYTTWVDPAGSDFTITVVKIDHDHAQRTRPLLPGFSVSGEVVEFELAPSMKVQDATELKVWHSNFQEAGRIFMELPPVKAKDGKLTLRVAVGDYYTVSTIATATKAKGSLTPKKPSSPQFPLPYSDDFEAVEDSQAAKYWTDQIGAFEVHAEEMAAVNTNKVMRMMVPQVPIGWHDFGSSGPLTLIGMREWADFTLSVDFKLPTSTSTSTLNSGCVGTRVDQMWKNGIALCASEGGTWQLTVGGPKLVTSEFIEIIQHGTTSALGTGNWHTLSLTTVGRKATGMLDSKPLFEDVAIRDIDTGFGAIGSNGWFPIEFDNVTITQAGDNWQPLPPPYGCPAAKVGTRIGTRECSANGIVAEDLEWVLRATDWSIVHKSSGLCLSASCTGAGAMLSLQICKPSDRKQQFPHDYTRIRNENMPIGFMTDVSVIPEGNSYPSLYLSLHGKKDGSVGVGKHVRQDELPWPAALIMCLVGPILIGCAYWWSRRRQQSHQIAFCNSVCAYLFAVGAGSLGGCIFTAVVTSKDRTRANLPLDVGTGVGTELWLVGPVYLAMALLPLFRIGIFKLLGRDWRSRVTEPTREESTDKFDTVPLKCEVPQSDDEGGGSETGVGITPPKLAGHGTLLSSGLSLFVLAHAALALQYAFDDNCLTTCPEGSTANGVRLIWATMQAFGLGLVAVAVPNLDVNQFFGRNQVLLVAILVLWASSYLALLLLPAFHPSARYSRTGYAPAMALFIYILARFKHIARQEGGYPKLTELVALVLALNLVGLGVEWYTDPLVHSNTGDWATWSYFPNTKQLRNQYVANPSLGYPMCLSTCSI